MNPSETINPETTSPSRDLSEGSHGPAIAERQILEVELRGGLLLGGSAGAGFDDATLRAADGLPYVPASALKGAIREQLARLVDGATVRRILGGVGTDPLADGESVSSEAPTVEERVDGGSTRVYFTDAVLHTSGPAEAERQLYASGRGFAARMQVALDRQRRRASDGRLFRREVLAPFAGDGASAEGPRFRSRVDLSLLDEADRRAFRGAVAAVFALGASRTAGLGAVRLRLLDPPPEAEIVAGETSIPERILGLRSPRVRLVLEARAPLCLGDHFRGNFIETLGYLPASALRGAVVAAALRHRGVEVDVFEEDWFQRLLVDPATCLRFGDALPVSESVGEAAGEPRIPPLTARACKRHGAGHGVPDMLIRDGLRGLAAEHGVHVAPEERCGTCGPRSRLTPLEGLLGGVDPERRVVSRLGLDRRFGRAAAGQYFSLELLEQGTRFSLVLEGVEEEGRKLLADAAREGLRLGHGRGQGYGRVAVVGASEPEDDDLASRLEVFDNSIRRRLERLAQGLGTEPRVLGAECSHLAVTLLSELMVEAPGGRKAEAAFLHALGLGDGVRAIYGQVRTAQRGGWDARARRPKPVRPVLAAGSVLLLRFEHSLEQLRPRLEELERRGAGNVREEGFGWLRVSDPIHVAGRPTAGRDADPDHDTRMKT